MNFISRSKEFFKQTGSNIISSIFISALPIIRSVVDFNQIEKTAVAAINENGLPLIKIQDKKAHIIILKCPQTHLHKLRSDLIETLYKTDESIFDLIKNGYEFSLSKTVNEAINEMNNEEEEKSDWEEEGKKIDVEKEVKSIQSKMSFLMPTIKKAWGGRFDEFQNFITGKMLEKGLPFLFKGKLKLFKPSNEITVNSYIDFADNGYIAFCEREGVKPEIIFLNFGDILNNVMTEAK